MNKRTVRAMSVSSFLLLLIVVCLTVSLVGGDREYGDPPSRRPLQRGPHQRPLETPSSSSSDESLTQLLNDSKLSQLLDDPDLWLILKKRLDLGGAGGPGTDGDRCSADERRNNTIIKTKDSLDAGAMFISSPPSVTNYRDCEEECCKEKTCNTAIVNLKDAKNTEGGGISCYLFNCQSPSVCIFTSHPGFIVLNFDSKKSVDQNKDELDKLASSSVNLSSVKTTTSTTLPSTTTTAVTVAGRIENDSPKKNFVSLFSECRRSSDCSDQNTDCLSGFCICQQGYHVVQMQCRKDCDQELEFECSNKNSPLFSECIAVYDYCDGIPQCSDGSDENSCLESSKHKGGGGQSRGRARDGVRPQQPTDANNTTVAVRMESSSVPSNIESAVSVSAPVAVIPSGSPSPIDGTKTNAVVKVSPTPSVDQKQTSSLAPDSDEEVKQEKVEQYFWKMETNRGAIVALVLGIVLTTTLLILAACRLRHFRKRYRKGRHVNSNEADYLINGMYL